ncbi:nicotinamidase-related amidase [Paenibacillus sp. 4624]|jgi:nicotinamidase-related amidase|uniref:Isochorismatase family protein n=1 Tax=Paenibacillus amylolyticus TaxID=1451 RepID=A0A5M9WUL4_PAEAM|nr:isochorismatase family protein [Paenibacillus amylolyticus]KAA8785149.1 isochorismatase family protein [Paenibacillus amylolyticus]
MNKCLIVLDVQRGLTIQRDVSATVSKIESVMAIFEKMNWPIIFTKHIDEQHEESSLYRGKADYLEIVVNTKQHLVLEKNKPSAFSNSDLKKWLCDQRVEHVFIVGFNMEYCCLFTAITAEHEGFKVTLIEDAAGTVNTEETYDMEGLDIPDFIGSILNWSGCIEVLYTDEFSDVYSQGVEK